MRKLLFSLVMIFYAFGATAQRHHAIVTKAGNLWVFGDNTYGQLGDGQKEPREKVYRVGDVGEWQSVACGVGFTVAIKKDGTLWSWGKNNLGQLGNGTTQEMVVPKRVNTDRDWLTVSAGAAHAVAKKTDGTLWAWGENTDGQLGIGQRGLGSNKRVPVKIGKSTDWEKIACGGDHTIATKKDGTLWAWGRNYENQLGRGNPHDIDRPYCINELKGWTKIKGGYKFTLGYQKPLIGNNDTDTSKNKLLRMNYNKEGKVLGLGRHFDQLQINRTFQEADWEEWQSPVMQDLNLAVPMLVFSRPKEVTDTTDSLDMALRRRKFKVFVKNIGQDVAYNVEVASHFLQGNLYDEAEFPALIDSIMPEDSVQVNFTFRWKENTKKGNFVTELKAKEAFGNDARPEVIEEIRSDDSFPRLKIQNYSFRGINSPEVERGKDFVLVLDIMNNGGETAKDGQIELTLPKQVTTRQGGLVFSVRDLTPNATTTVQLVLKTALDLISSSFDIGIKLVDATEHNISIATCTIEFSKQRNLGATPDEISALKEEDKDVSTSLSASPISSTVSETRDSKQKVTQTISESLDKVIQIENFRFKNGVGKTPKKGEVATMGFDIKNVGPEATPALIVQFKFPQGITSLKGQKVSIGAIKASASTTVDVPLMIDKNYDSNKINVGIEVLSNASGQKAQITNELALAETSAPSELPIANKKPKKEKTLNKYSFEGKDGEIKKGDDITLRIEVVNNDGSKVKSLKLTVNTPEYIKPKKGNTVNVDNLKPHEVRQVPIDMHIGKEYDKDSAEIGLEVLDKETQEKTDKKYLLEFGPQYKNELENLQDAPVAKSLPPLPDLEPLSDVDENIPQTKAKRDEIYAIAIGNENHINVAGVMLPKNDAKFASQDAIAFAHYAVNTLGIPKENVGVLINADKKKIINLIRTVHKMATESKGKKEIVFYFSGKGFMGLDQERYILPADIPIEKKHLGIKLKDVYSKLAGKNVVKITSVVDVSFSNNKKKDIEPLEPETDNVVVFSGSSSTEIAPIIKDKNHGLYTYCFLKVLKDNAGSSLSYSALAEKSIEMARTISEEKFPRVQAAQVQASENLGDSWKSWMIKK